MGPILRYAHSEGCGLWLVTRIASVLNLTVNSLFNDICSNQA